MNRVGSFIKLSSEHKAVVLFWMLGIFYLGIFMSGSAHCQDRATCVPMEISLMKLTEVEAAIEVDSNIINEARLLAQSTLSARGYHTLSSSIELKCVFRLPQLDNLLLMQFYYIPSLFPSELIIYDPLTGQYVDIYQMGLGGFNYLILKHKQNSNFQDKRLMTRLYFTLRYGVEMIKMFSEEFEDIVIEISADHPDMEAPFRKAIKKCPSGIIQETEIRDEFRVYECVYLRKYFSGLGFPFGLKGLKIMEEGHVFYKITAQMFNGVFLKYEVEEITTF